MVNCEHELSEEEIQYGHCICGAPAHIVVQTCACGAGIGNKEYFCSNPDCPNFQKTENIIKKDDMTEIECNHQVSIERIANILKIRLCDIRFFHRNKINDGIYIVKVRW